MISSVSCCIKDDGSFVLLDELVHITTGCVLALEHIGELKSCVNAIFVQPCRDYGDNSPTSLWLEVRVALAPPRRDMGNSQEPDIILEKRISYPTDSDTEPREYLARKISDYIILEVHKRACQLKEHAESWEKMLSE